MIARAWRHAKTNILSEKDIKVIYAPIRQFKTQSLVLIL